MRTITCAFWTLEIEDSDGGRFHAGQITRNDLARETCPSCGERFCQFSCDGSQGADENNTEDENEVLARIQWNAAADGIESLVLALACVGVDVESKKFQDSVTAAIDGISNNFS